MAIDPVCKMNVDPTKAAAKAEYAGQTYYFCSAACHKFAGSELGPPQAGPSRVSGEGEPQGWGEHKAFTAEPQKYAGRPPGGTPPHGRK